jgi:hypothetical protein
MCAAAASARSAFSKGYREADRKRTVNREQRRLRQLHFKSRLEAFRRKPIVDEARQSSGSGGLSEPRARICAAILPNPAFVHQCPTAGANVVYGVADQRMAHGRPARAGGPATPEPLTRTVDGARRGAVLEAPARGQHRGRQHARDAPRKERATRRSCPRVSISRGLHAVLDNGEGAGFRAQWIRSQ